MKRIKCLSIVALTLGLLMCLGQDAMAQSNKETRISQRAAKYRSLDNVKPQSTIVVNNLKSKVGTTNAAKQKAENSKKNDTVEQKARTENKKQLTQNQFKAVAKPAGTKKSNTLQNLQPIERKNRANKTVKRNANQNVKSIREIKNSKN